MFKQKLKYFSILVLLLFVLIPISPTVSRFTSMANISDNIEIAKPVIKLIPISELSFDSLYPSSSIEYYFNVINYDGDIINDISLNYYLEFSFDRDELPLTYELYEITGGNVVEIPLYSGVTELFTIGHTEMEEKQYKVVFTWPANENSLDYINKNINFNVDLVAYQEIES